MDTKVGTGGTAHPDCNEASMNGTMGMSLRDYFAGQVLAGMDEVSDASRMAEWAYRIADAMIAAREVKP
ncbi:hypothetical protein phiGT1_48 [Sulfitobacter phage phiGT1]|nr:hypothetical protein phiGT1_48 [Sulfitobacter phage phiGT1]